MKEIKTTLIDRKKIVISLFIFYCFVASASYFGVIFYEKTYNKQGVHNEY